MKTAIVILNWNGKQLLQQFLPSVIEHSKNADVYVADNASTDDSVAFVKANFSEVKIIQNSENGGYAKGYNDALQHIDADVFALVNSDIEVTKDWLSPIQKVFETEPNTAIIQPKILDFKDKSKFEYAGAGGGFIDKHGYPYCRGRIFDNLETDNGQYNDTTEIFWASGACFFIRKAVFNELNGFDTDFFAHQEEIDLCWRAFNKGYTAKYVGASTVYHVGGATLNSSNPQKTYLNFRNSLFMLLKNLPKKGSFFTIFKRMSLDGIAGFRFLLQGKFAHCFAVFRAHMAFYASYFKMKAKRSPLASKKDYYQQKSIVYQHFINGKRTFGEL